VSQQKNAKAHLEQLFRCYQVTNLVGISPSEFEANLRERLTIEDDAPFEPRFRWGHDHNFGPFKLKGTMSNRHITLLAGFVGHFGALPLDLTGKRVLDIGVWTGGTSLVFLAMGARVTSIEPVLKYVSVMRYLAKCFDLKAWEVAHRSVFDLGIKAFLGAYDFVHYSGVVYHVTDPVLSLRHCFNALKDGGTLLLETAFCGTPGRFLKYQGPTQAGRNWFFPSREALKQMLLDVGFADVRLGLASGDRISAVAVRREWSPMVRLGLSDQGVK
jgi:2-polyprenyl-3-methyl-5-hydroxy-6-metoxy-1,4-benzoquinol methylase